MERSSRTRRARRRLAAALAVLAAAWGLAACIPPIPNPPDPAPAQVAGTPTDYASDVYSDPWDFSNPEDLDLTGWGTTAMTNPSISGGMLHVTSPGSAGTLYPVAGIIGAVPWGRDSGLHPVDTSVYRRVSFSMRSTAAPSSGQLIWFTCVEQTVSCMGNKGFVTGPANTFTTYDVDPTTGASGVPWSGLLTGVRIIPSAVPATIDVDWIRLRTATAPVAPPADPPPLAVVDSPGYLDGEDYATSHRGGDAWDFSQPSDVAYVGNTVYYVNNGVLTGQNAGPLMNDPYVGLPLNGAIDGAVYHYVTARIWYGGQFGLADAPGGGMVGRFVWSIAGHPTEAQSGRGFVVHPGWNYVQFDMATNPVVDIVDPGTPGNHYGWYGYQIATLDFDPHEDPGARQFVVDDIRITADPQGAGGFPIRFHDNAWQAGTVAEVHAQSADGSTQLLGSFTMTGPSATFDWTGAPAGKWWIYVVLRDPGGQTSTRYASVPLRIS